MSPLLEIRAIQEHKHEALSQRAALKVWVSSTFPAEMKYLVPVRNISNIGCRAVLLNSGVGTTAFSGSSTPSKKDIGREMSFHKSENKGRKHRKQRGYFPVSRRAEEEEWGRQHR